MLEFVFMKNRWIYDTLFRITITKLSDDLEGFDHTRYRSK